MDDPNIAMEEYIRLEEEKARKRGKVFNWETSKILFDDYDDEDCTIIFDKNSFSYKKNSTNDLKTDSENDNEKVNLPSLSSPEPAISCFDDLDFFNDFENEFPAIIYNDAQTSKSDLVTESILSPQCIDEFDLNGETSLSEYDEEEQNGLEYTDADIADFKERLERIYSREIQRVQVVDFQRMSKLIRDGLFARMVMEHRDDFLSTLRFRDILLDLDAPDSIQFQLGVRHQKRFAAGRKSGAHISGGQFVARLAENFGLMTAEILQGLTIFALELPIIDMTELVRLQIYMEVDNTWAWVALGPERHSDAVAGAPEAAKDAPAVDEGGQAVSTPVQAPQQPPPPPPTTARTMPQRLGRLEEEMQGLLKDVGSLRGLMERSMTDQGRFSTWMIACMA
ncbi:hypothetical protein Tco_0466125 [Tanacetum coccineum]